MNTPSVSLKDVIEPYRTALDSLRTLDETLTNFRNKKNLLEQEILVLDERLGTLEQSRPQLLESVLAGTQPETMLTETELEATRLKSERKSKTDLIQLVNSQIASKTEVRVNGNARLEPLRRRIFAAIEQDILAQLPPDFLTYLGRLSAVSVTTGRSGASILESMLPERKHADWERERNKILAEYGVPSH